MAKFKGAVIECVVCKKHFKVPKCRANTAKTCSTECSYKVRMQHRLIPRAVMVCAECGKPFTEHQCHAGRRRFCSYDCQHKSEQFKAEKSEQRQGGKNPMWEGGISVSAISKSGRHYARSSLAKEGAKTAARRAQQLLATPAWADPVLILAFYEDAQLISASTGIVHHVDHMVPLQSKYVCGLHTHDNLRAMIGADNCSKSNRHWPDKP